ncbi:TetR/AcrR family transcriptional regulator [Lysinibacillus endophyticus]|uniref:TetR/AcrR family transcriptional regulator n=1 Tax=Ureibacillus endophyticus TaxID=1978490 RepID=UPI00209E168E|nr:TetR/AcrR family transcriptional regulator [Lysinibacillus endophyticus]MCP1146629.1 TetR/AcrR family transcriptional regulator [Lysinibacillus endophyticus]
MNKKISSKSITKSNLASAYWTLYKENGVQKVTVKDITSLAGYNRSTFYEYFKDVQDVCISQVKIEPFIN